MSKQKKESSNNKVDDLSCPKLEEIERLKSQLIQNKADFENFKKRTEKEKANWSFLIKSETIKTILPFMDEIELAIKDASQGPDKNEKIEKGLNLIKQNFEKNLKKMGIKKADYSKFNPEHHEAIVQVESEKVESGQIVDILKHGYILEDKVIRFAQVSVAK